MKIQDIAFFVVLIFLIFKRNPNWAVVTGILSLALSIPLFYFRIFFTAERLVQYAAGFFLLAIIFHLFKLNER